MKFRRVVAFAAMLAFGATSLAGKSAGAQATCRFSSWSAGGQGQASMTTGTMTVQSGTRCLTPTGFPSFRNARIDQQPANGRLELLPDGYAYTPNPGFVGNDVFRITWWNATDAYRRGVDILAAVVAPPSAPRPPEPARAATAAPTRPPASTLPVSAGRPGSVAQDAEARLRQLQRLRDQGLITEDEYRTRRQRILDAL